MQLIIETEKTIDVKNKMSSVKEESKEGNAINGTPEKDATFIGNKENINTQSKVICGDTGKNGDIKTEVEEPMDISETEAVESKNDEEDLTDVPIDANCISDPDVQDERNSKENGNIHTNGDVSNVAESQYKTGEMDGLKLEFKDTNINDENTIDFSAENIILDEGIIENDDNSVKYVVVETEMDVDAAIDNLQDEDCVPIKDINVAKSDESEIKEIVSAKDVIKNITEDILNEEPTKIVNNNETSEEELNDLTDDKISEEDKEIGGDSLAQEEELLGDKCENDSQLTPIESQEAQVTVLTVQGDDNEFTVEFNINESVNNSADKVIEVQNINNLDKATNKETTNVACLVSNKLDVESNSRTKSNQLSSEDLDDTKTEKADEIDNESVSADDKVESKDDEEVTVLADKEEESICIDDDKEVIDLLQNANDDNTKEKEMEVMEIDDNDKSDDVEKDSELTKDTAAPTQEKPTLRCTPICKLSNTLDILSDDDEEPSKEEPVNNTEPSKINEKMSINLEDDDDIVLIDEDNSNKDKSEPDTSITQDVKHDEDVPEEKKEDISMESPEIKPNDSTPEHGETVADTEITTKSDEKKVVPKEMCDKPLLSKNFISSCKKNLIDMSREDLEEFCILKIVESIVDRSNLNEIKTKLKTLGHSIDLYKKKTTMLTKQNRDLQVVLKSVQEEQKKNTSNITPLKITRSVGMQVLMMEMPLVRRKPGAPATPAPTNAPNTRSRLQNPSPRQAKPPTNQQIPVPRLVPANGSTVRAPTSTPPVVSPASNKSPATTPNGVRTAAQRLPEKRKAQSITVDLTDDEPLVKIAPRPPPIPPVRLVASQNLLAPRQQSAQNSPRKVYIPISGPQSQQQGLRPGQTLLLKNVGQGIRGRGPVPQMVRVPQNHVRLTRVQGARHPAPLPDCAKQAQPPNWKAIPPPPDLKLSKVENGIVISWKIEGYSEETHEEIASYQLYAYQETSAPPNTNLWKKIGDVKALPLPMACTLTQFMAGFKYYFAVRAVDVKSRLGVFSLPGSILLLNKV